ncbi:unnamed protein product [Prunus armeniaca]|uniref:Pectinesterase inhibitor domain-containing protein n=2 Tax=Prunus TaxID=3754 RepID=A0A6J5TG26_PRUAR|nr:PREDICTED: cell wall / vacuolar inhibitor of fructosidase 1-like [Prunus mume]KAH0993128.1 hypothetical protein GBA52_004611 [Prunus armeniaca]CAB4262519.1 unnamed protein product [Prunus armeniaca]CAB4293111.1 unnamed protein product [Prunus armeniaca]
MNSSTSLLQLVCCTLLVFLLPVALCSRVVFPTDANLIDQTCKQTPNYALCVSSLKSDPRSSTADVSGLGVILVDIVKAKSTDTLNKINTLLKQRPGNQALKSCARFYDTVVEALVPEAQQGFSLGNPKFAEQGMNDAAGEAETCEDGFSGKSPLTDNNKAVHDIAAVAAAIARTLL